ncbi:hypothetical protein EZS27_025329 [termite gut metagenome]|uniref:Uncharacterized protein n=1 Tax=termite gut metagenome TaxID=433724 RepID=A0A5J4QU98_9ZZZZ
MVVLHSSKEFLHGLLVYINHYLSNERKLTLKSNYQVFPVQARGIDFAGYIFYHTHIRARKKNKQGLIRKVLALRKQGRSQEEIRLETASRVGFMIHCNSRHFLKTLNMTGMKKFSEVAKTQGKFEGSKLHIDEVLDKIIKLLAYGLTDSKHNADKCLTIQYEMQENTGQADGTTTTDWVKHITFTGSKSLVNQLEGIEAADFPFTAKIIKQPLARGKCFYKFVDPDE